MKKILLLSAFYILHFTFSVHAQYYQWITGGGSSGQPSATDEEIVNHMCIDDHGNIYALSNVADDNIRADTFYRQHAYNHGAPYRPHILFTSYTCDGKMRFAKLIEAYNYGVATGLVYSNGKIYVSGVMVGNNKHIGEDAYFNTNNETVFLSKFDTSGQYEWNRFTGADQLSTLFGTSFYGWLSTDASRNLHQFQYFKSGVQITPSIVTQRGNYDIIYDPSGNLLSVNRLPFSDTDYYIIKATIDRSTDSKYILMYYYGQSLTRAGTYIVAYDAANNELWRDSVNRPGGAGISSLEAISNDGLYVCGSGNMPSGMSFDIAGLSAVNTAFPTNGALSIVAKLGLNDGMGKWIYHVDGKNAVQRFNDLTITPQFNIGLVGTMGGPAVYGTDTISTTINQEPQLFVIDTAGNMISFEHFPCTNFYNTATAIVSDKNGNMIVGGFTTLSVTGGSLPPYYSNGSSDFFVLKYGVPCYCDQSMVPVSGFTYVFDTLPNTNIFTFTGTTPIDSVVWDFGDGSPKLNDINPTHTFWHQEGGGSYHVCATAYGPCGAKKFCKDVNVSVSVAGVDGSHIRIYPNPVTSQLLAEGLRANTKVQLFNIVGEEVYHTRSTGSTTILQLETLQPGSYLLQLTQPDGSRSMKKIVKE